MENNKTKQWKKENKTSACTKAPWELLIPFKERADVMLKIKQECINEYGYDFNECPKRKVCITKECMGRPLPWKSETAKPYLERLQERFTVKNKLLYISTDCSTCPISNTCASTCSQVFDYIERGKANDQVNFNFTHELEKQQIKPKETQEESLGDLTLTEIPWDCLTERKKKVVYLYLYEQKDYLHVARETGLYNQATARYEFYAALTKLSKVANIRKFILANNNNLSKLQLTIFKKAFFNNKSYVKIATELKVSPQAVQQIINRILKTHNVKWNVFVKKKDGKLIFNVPGIMK